MLYYDLAEMTLKELSAFDKTFLDDFFWFFIEIVFQCDINVKIVFSILYIELFFNTFTFLLQNIKLGSLKTVVRSCKKTYLY